MKTLKFAKMHGLGNDFMVIDAVNQDFFPETAPIAAWADRHTGIGFDQLLIVEKPWAAAADFRYRIFNADGSEVEQCGNGARCFARFVRETGLSDKDILNVETAKGMIVLKTFADGLVEVDMGVPRLNAADIPFSAEKADDGAVLHNICFDGGNAAVSCVNMGNPHAVLLTDDAARAPVADWGASLCTHPRFPERANIGFMQIENRRRIRLRVFERGVGETLACGTGACAAVVAGVRQNLLDRDRDIAVALPGGELLIRWTDGGTVLMRGSAQFVFEGKVSYE